MKVALTVTLDAAAVTIEAASLSSIDAEPPIVRAGTPAEIDAYLDTIKSTVVVVTWGGRNWLHRLGPTGRELYHSQVDLEASFICENRFTVNPTSFTCVSSFGTPEPAVSLLSQIESHGRLVWEPLSGGTRGFWIKDFYTPLSKLKPVTAPGWVNTPVNLELPEDAPPQSV